jgi:hypothetical protein
VRDLNDSEAELERATELSEARADVLAQTRETLGRVEPLLTSVDGIRQVAVGMQEQRDAFRASADSLTANLIDFANYLLSDPYALSDPRFLTSCAEVVLTELPRGIAERLQQLGDRDILGLEADIHAGHPDLAQAGAVDALAGDERRAAGGAALLAVGVREPHPLVGDPVDVRRPVAHQPVAVAAQVRDPDVVSPDHEDVRLVSFGHALHPSSRPHRESLGNELFSLRRGTSKRYFTAPRTIAETGVAETIRGGW